MRSGLFEPGATPNALRLVESKPMGKGTLLAIYRPAAKPTYGASRRALLIDGGRKSTTGIRPCRAGAP